MALADPVRRALVARPSRGPATVNELAAPFTITKQAVSKDIQVLEQAGLVTRTRDAQRRPVHLTAAAQELTSWIDRYRSDAERNYRRLDTLLASITDGDDKDKSDDDRTRPGGTRRHPGHGVHPSSGMEGGMTEGYDKLDALLAAPWNRPDRSDPGWSGHQPGSHGALDVSARFQTAGHQWAHCANPSCRGR